MTKKGNINFDTVTTRIVDRHRYYANPDPDPHQNNADPHSDSTKFYTCWKPLLQIRIPHWFKFGSGSCFLFIFFMSQCSFVLVLLRSGSATEIKSWIRIRIFKPLRNVDPQHWF
jgi:hypothetical protein